MNIFSLWENENLQYSWIIFLHSSIVIIASRVLATDKCQSGELSSDRILYCYDFIFSVLQLEWKKVIEKYCVNLIIKCPQ